MKKVLLGVVFVLALAASNAQGTDSTSKNVWKKYDLSNRANDHFMLQYGLDGWATTPDSTSPSGFSRHFNFYFMLDKPFKNNPHMSVGYGLGLGTSNIFFKNTYVNLKSFTSTLPFTSVGTSSVDHFSKFKLTTMFVELPFELRYSANPVTPDKGLKASVGVKLGYLLNAYTKGKNALDASGNTIYGPTYKEKEYDTRFINHTRVAVTGRLGVGNISLDVSYQVTNFLKVNTGPAINPYSVGLTLSGL
ncbi:MAG TPA: outer membrane beta-barrel protein [Chitinophagaceae bacterium]|nr:outer membrane beta-barrel protein [Chitinophagaceae bacterium]